MQIALLGDVMLGRLVNRQLRTAGPHYPWGDTVPLLRRRMQELCANLGTGSFWDEEGGFLEIPINQEPGR